MLYRVSFESRVFQEWGAGQADVFSHKNWYRKQGLTNVGSMLIVRFRDPLFIL